MKELLIVRVTDDVPDLSVQEIYCHAKHYGINPSHVDVSSIEQLRSKLQGRKLDYIYFAGHGNETCFSDNQSFLTSWSEIGQTICESNCLNPNSIILLYCCKGGINTVAYQLIAECNQISYICGAKQNMTNIDLIIGFNVFLYNVESRNISPVIAAEKSRQATDIEFECFDRIAVESNPQYFYNYCKTCPKPSTKQC